MPAVSIEGDGLAACCCARLLTAHGIETTYRATARERSPVLLLSPATAHLLRDVFGDDSFLRGLHPIRRRIVAWQRGVAPVTLPHAGWVASEAKLLAALWQRLPEPSSIREAPWRILSTGVHPGFSFGDRTARAFEADLSAGADAEACSIEAVAEGWLFLLPFSLRAAALLCVGGEPDRLLGLSRWIAARVGGLRADTGQFPSAPFLADALCDHGWLACGTAALRFDPVCGEGAGHAVREAILAAATIRALHSGEPADPLLAHYEARLRAGFERHVGLCAQFYATGGPGPWWDEQQRTTALQARSLASQTPARYRLHGFTLESLAPEMKQPGFHLASKD